jgi:hypothetical protein
MKNLFIAVTLAAAVFSGTAQASVTVHRLEFNKDGSGWGDGVYFMTSVQCKQMLVIGLNAGNLQPGQVRCVEVEIN